MCGIFTSGSAWCPFPLLVPGEGGSGLQGLQQTEHKNAMGEYTEYIFYCRRAILFLSSSKILTPHPPLRPASLSSPATKAGGTYSPGGEGDGGSIFWKTREIGLPSYSKICTLWVSTTTQEEWGTGTNRWMRARGNGVIPPRTYDLDTKSETHNNREGALHDCLPRLLGDGDK